jgi:hypothetical protein
MRHIILISGKDSLATALVQIARDPMLPYELVHNDVGWDLPETLAWIERVGEHFGRPIIKCGDDLTEISFEQNFLPTRLRRFCTRLAKIKPLRDYLGSQPATVYYGLRADESDRIGFAPDENDNIRPSYPLRELGIGLYEAWGLCQEAGLLPPNFRWTWMEVRVRDLLCGDDYLLDDMMEWERDSLLAWRSRSNCDRCFYACQYEKVGLLEHHPPRFFAAVDMERRLGHKGFTWHSDYSLPSLIPRAAEIKEKRARAIVKFLRTKQQRYLFADDDSQPDELAVTSCGLLCGK